MRMARIRRGSIASVVVFAVVCATASILQQQPRSVSDVSQKVVRLKDDDLYKGLIPTGEYSTGGRKGFSVDRGGDFVADLLEKIEMVAVKTSTDPEKLISSIAAAYVKQNVIQSDRASLRDPAQSLEREDDVSLRAEKKEEEEEEEELTAATAWGTLTAIVSVLIAVTVIFEHMKHSLEHSTPLELLPVVEHLFGELTVLGFIGLSVFVVTKAGVLSSVSEQLFNEKELLTELTEVIHMVLFLGMLLFLSQVVILLKIATVVKDAWLGWEKEVLKAKASREPESARRAVIVTEAEKLGTLLLAAESGPLLSPSTWLKIRVQRLHVEFLSLREAFVRKDFDSRLHRASHDRAHSHHHDAHSGGHGGEHGGHGGGHGGHGGHGHGHASVCGVPVVTREQVLQCTAALDRYGGGFELGRYFGKLMDAVLAELVEVPSSAWLWLWGSFVVICTVFVTFGPWTAVFICVLGSYGMTAALYIAHVRMRRVISKLTPQTHLSRAHSIAYGTRHRSQTSLEQWPLLLTADHESATSATPSQAVSAAATETAPASEASVANASATSGGGVVVPQQPPYLWHSAQSSLSRGDSFQRVASSHMIEKKRLHILLFPGGERGPRHILFALRVGLLLLSFYAGVLVVVFIPALLSSSRGAGGSIGTVLIILLVAMIPLLVAYGLGVLVLRDLVVAVSIEQLKRPEKVLEVVREMRTRQLLQLLTTLHAMRAFALTRDAIHCAEAEEEQEEEEGRDYEDEGVEIAERLMKVLDRDGSGDVSVEELRRVLTALFGGTVGGSVGAMAEADVEKLVKALDKDADGRVELHELADWVAVNARKKRRRKMANEGGEERDEEDERVEELVEALFSMLDHDKSGSISVKELIDTVGVLGERSGLSPADVAELANEVDLNDDGEISKHEFEQLVAKHLRDL